MTDDENKAAPEAANAHSEPQAAPLAERVAVLERENQDLKDRLLRALAEMENLRRRSEKELQDQRAYSITKFAGDMVGSADNLRRALDSRPKLEEGAALDDVALKTFVDGVELTERELLKALERHGVKKREPVGERFDPHRDQAMFEIPDESVPSGTVMQVMQPGYMIGERVLRPAMVGVSKGGPARMAEPADAPKASPAPTPDEPRPHIDKRA